ncbi:MULTISPECIES: hypothetical protein [unclassified Novosphingobium]|uniref:hypothetical protein n=1 Tax=unclassified Novosphingobium TaxID=2644732 RepID=UPI00146C3DCA|nr:MULTISPECIES: hypothetical protein [unclassified Novosphingobium]NMN03899.1 hypothetical protein [Novosphingobium sp. SG919]NMN86111.1 hypothetical protein [Novosphingobium sp. SG916]
MSARCIMRRLAVALPKRSHLSITGLLDWSAGGDPAQLAQLGSIVDDIVLQTYQGRQTIPGYEAYLASLRRLPFSYRIGLVEGGVWNAPAWLRSDPHFQGYVIFLLPGPKGLRAQRASAAELAGTASRKGNQLP